MLGCCSLLWSAGDLWAAFLPGGFGGGKDARVQLTNDAECCQSEDKIYDDSSGGRFEFVDYAALLGEG